MGKRLRTYSKGELTGYLVGMFGQNIIYNVIATGLTFYFQNVICIPAAALLVIMTVARVWDAINDPMMGTIVDKTKSKWGKCRPYLIFVPPIIGLITMLTFINSNYATASSTGMKVAIVAWAGISYIAWGMIYTVCDIPLWGITSLMTEDENDRSKVLSLARIIAGVAGIGVLIVPIAQGVSGIFAAQGFDEAESMRRGFILTAFIMTLISTICFEFAGLCTKERITETENKHSFKENFKIMFRNKPFSQILISGILRSPIQLLMLVAMTLIAYYYADGNIMNILKTDANGGIVGINWTILVNVGLIAVGIFVGQFAAMGLTPTFIKHYEKKKIYNFFSIAGAVPFALIYVFYLLAKGDLTVGAWPYLIAIAFFFGSAAMGGINVLQSVMIADCVDHEEYYYGERTDGVFFSGQSFITKLSAGIATIIQQGAFAIVGYSGANVDKLNKDLEQGASFITYNGGKYASVMFFLISIPPAIGMLLSAIPTLKYALSDAEHKRILDELVEKRNAQGIESNIEAK